MRSTGATSKYSLCGVFFSRQDINWPPTVPSRPCTLHSAKFLNYTAAKRTFQISSVLPTRNPFLFNSRDSRYQLRLFGYTSAFLIDQHFLGTYSTSPASRWLQPTRASGFPSPVASKRRSSAHQRQAPICLVGDWDS